MSGNCASGKPRMATSPAITVTMEITIATIGRLIKKLEIMRQSYLSMLCDKRIGTIPTFVIFVSLVSFVRTLPGDCDIRGFKKDFSQRAQRSQPESRLMGHQL